MTFRDVFLQRGSLPNPQFLALKQRFKKTKKKKVAFKISTGLRAFWLDFSGIDDLAHLPLQSAQSGYKP